MIQQGKANLLIEGGKSRQMSKRSWLLPFAFLPFILFLLLRFRPDLDLSVEAPVFHFYIVTFTSFAALVSALFVASAVENRDNPHILFLTMGFVAIAALFLIHGLATPGIVFQGFNQVVGWSSRLSLFMGSLLFALGLLDWPPHRSAYVLKSRNKLWAIAGAAYGLYLLVALSWPTLLASLAAMEPWLDFSLAGLAAALYLWAGWQAARKALPGSEQLWTAISISLVLLAQAQISMTLGPLWHLSWWLYHVLMLAGFLLSVTAIAIEYEALKSFRATSYFAALGSLAALGLALAAGWVTSNLMNEPEMQLPVVAVSLLVSTLLFVVLFFVVRRADEIISEQTEALKQEQLLRQDLTRLVVHDLKNPLAAIVASLSALQARAESSSNSRQEQLIEGALGSSTEMQQLLSDMLDYERLQEGALQLKLEPCELGPLLEQRAAAIQGRLDQQDQTLKLEIDGRLPLTELDPELMVRVVDNLLSNAVKFVGPGGTIKMRAWPQEGSLFVEVEDDGPGIPAAERNRIFERFYQSSISKRRGAGLGLSFCRLAVQAHGGSIWAAESESGGAVFRLSIPVNANLAVDP
jgi:signal transduction histidine kinase